MSQIGRIAQGGRINRDHEISFLFNGKKYSGFEGDTIASALLANRCLVVNRSFKYRRVRGIMAAGAEECNAIFQVEENGKTTPNCRATQTLLKENMVITTKSGWPSFNTDITQVLRYFHQLMPVGFYYKTFIKPKFLWPLYEKLIRSSTGLGVAPKEKDHERYDQLNHHCDYLIIGGGAAGIAATLKLANSGKKIILVDEQAVLGGQLLSSNQSINQKPINQWLKEAVSELSSFDNIVVLTNSTAFGLYDYNLVSVVEAPKGGIAQTKYSARAQRRHRIRAKDIILATGSIERPMVFSNNDLPGIMLAQSVSTYIHRYAVLPGKKVVIFTANNHAYQTAFDVVEKGGEVVAIVDIRSQVNATLRDKVTKLNINLMTGHAVVEALGKKIISAVNIATFDIANNQVGKDTLTLACDLVAMSAGFSPVVHLSSHTGMKPKWDQEKIAFVPGAHVDALYPIGACNGFDTISDCLNDGHIMASELLKEAVSHTPFYQVEDELSAEQQEIFYIPHQKNLNQAPKQFVDFQLDVTSAGILLAAKEGYDSIELVKRYTALGFGTDQGKLGNINGIGILAKHLGKPISEVGTTVFRPSYTPSTFGALAGRNAGKLFAPERRTAIHHWHDKYGAKWENVGDWKRPWFYPKGSETLQQAVNRECLAVRNSVGMLDASTLGKIDIQGEDAAEFINRIYTNAYLKLAPGKCRYGLMLKEDGMVFDDGVTACLGDNHYLMFTTTGGAASVLSWLECWHQTEWPELKVYFTSVTDHWATVTVSGPNARKVLENVCQDIDFSKDAFKFLEFKEGTVKDIKARIFRISFTGELSYEINVPANYAHYIWQEIYQAGQLYDITPYGTETMHVLRAEKGFIIVGQDTDGSVTPTDLNMDWIVSKKKQFSFIGKRGLARQDCMRNNRKQLVGLKPKQSQDVLPEGGQMVNSPKDREMQGHITSSYYSAYLGHAFALALIKSGLNRMGETIYCPLSDGRVIEAEIVSSVFYDPKGEKQHVD